MLTSSIANFLFGPFIMLIRGSDFNERNQCRCQIFVPSLLTFRRLQQVIWRDLLACKSMHYIIHQSLYNFFKNAINLMRMLGQARILRTVLVRLTRWTYNSLNKNWSYFESNNAWTSYYIVSHSRALRCQQKKKKCSNFIRFQLKLQTEENTGQVLLIKKNKGERDKEKRKMIEKNKKSWDEIRNWEK